MNQLLKKLYLAINLNYYFLTMAYQNWINTKNIIKAKKNKNGKRIISYEYLLNSLFNHIEIVPSKHYCDKIAIAYDIMKDIDEKDTICMALALKLNSNI